MNYFKKNIVPMRKRYGDNLNKIYYKDLDGIDENIGIDIAYNGDNYIYIVKNGYRWKLNSSLDPEYASKKYAERYEIKPYGIYFVFGFSDGRCIRELLSKCDETNKIMICVPEVETFIWASYYFDIYDILNDYRIVFCFPELENNLDIIIQDIVDYSRIKLLEFCILPSYDILYAEVCERYMDSVIENMRVAIVNKETHFAFDRLIPQHILFHMGNMISYPNIEQLKEKLKGKNIKNIPAIIVSAGPSLDKNIHLLKKAKKRAFIIAVDASVRAVINSGVIPDLLCSVDPNTPERFMNDLDMSDIYWACNQWSNPELINKYAKNIFYYGSFGNWWNQEIENILGYSFPDIEPGGSVSTEALMLAKYLGFKRIVLIGQDLAFTGGVSHTKGIGDALGDNDEYIKSRQIVEVEGIDGTMLQTDYQMWFYKKWFEKAIRIYKDEIRVIDATEGGAKIEGAELMTLKEVINNECNEEINMLEIEQSILPAFTSEQQSMLTDRMKDLAYDIDEFDNMITEIIKKQTDILKEMDGHPADSSEDIKLLKEVNRLNQSINKSTIIDYISMYSAQAEYELGDSIYADQDLSNRQLVEKSLALLKGYQNGAKLFKEDFENIILNGDN